MTESSYRPPTAKILICLFLILSMPGCVPQGKSTLKPAVMRQDAPKPPSDVTVEADLEAMKTSIRFKPDKGNTNWNSAARYWSDGDIKQAAAQMREYVELDQNSPDSAEAHNIIGIDYYGDRNYDVALKEFRIAVKLNPNEQQYSYNEALTLARLNRYDEADRAFARAPKLKAGQYLRQVYAERIQVNKARRLYNTGCVAMDDRDFSRAIELFQKALELVPDMVEAHVNLGVLYGMQSGRSNQLRHLKTATRLSPDDPSVRYNLGLAYYDAENYSKARVEFIRAIKLDPSLRNAHFKLGMILYKAKNITEAAREFERCLELFPNWFEAHTNLGTCYLKIGNAKGAVEHFEEAVQLRPRSAEAHYNLGEAYIGTENFDMALVLFREALKINPGYGQARARLYEVEKYQSK